ISPTASSSVGVIPAAPLARAATATFCDGCLSAALLGSRRMSVIHSPISTTPAITAMAISIQVQPRIPATAADASQRAPGLWIEAVRWRIADHLPSAGEAGPSRDGVIGSGGLSRPVPAHPLPQAELDTRPSGSRTCDGGDMWAEQQQIDPHS